MNRSVKFLLSAFSTLAVLCIASVAFAQPDATAAAAPAVDVLSVTKAGQGGWIALAAGAALDGIARNPGAADKIRGPMILGLALIESLVIYALIISILLVTTKL